MIFLLNKDSIEVKKVGAREETNSFEIYFLISRTSTDGPGICLFTTMRDRFMPSAGMQ